MPQKIFQILLVEDCAADATLIQKFLLGSGLPVHVTWVRDGIEALDFLHRRGPYPKAVIPHLILLDLNLPKMEGREILAEIRQDPRLRALPVVILTTSNANSDIQGAYDQMANAYLIKPSDIFEFEALMTSLVDFWFRKALLPTVDPLRS